MRSRRAAAQSTAARAKFDAHLRPQRFELISNLSHELRVPLQILNGYVEILAEDWGARLGEEPMRMLERIRLATGELTQTLENLLEYAAAMAGTQAAVRETVDAAELAAELQPTFAAMARRKKIFLVWRLEPRLRLVNCERRRLVSILANLVSNAIKFTERGGVTVKMRRVRLRGESIIELEVADTGIGIDPERIEEAFAPFVQLSTSAVRRYRGLGLGLALVRRNAKLIGASIEVKSKRSAGTRFRIRFPESPRG